MENKKGKKPKHQNDYKFKIDKNPHKIMIQQKAQLTNLCEHCFAKIKWKIEYGKYKPLTNPSKCVKCLEKNIVKAYRILCDKCSKENGICSKCGSSCTFMKAHTSKEENEAKFEKVKHILEGLKEREKKTIMRQLLKDEIEYVEGEGLVYTENGKKIEENLEGKS